MHVPSCGCCRHSVVAVVTPMLDLKRSFRLNLYHRGISMFRVTNMVFQIYLALRRPQGQFLITPPSGFHSVLRRLETLHPLP